MKVLLINPPKRHRIWVGIPEIFSRGIFLFPPLGLMYLKAYLQAHTAHRVELLDTLLDDLSFSEIEERVKSSKPDMVGIMALTHNLVDVQLTVAAVKNALPDVPVVLGGPHVHSFPHRTMQLKGVDYAICGDGEVPLARLADALDGGGDLSTVPSLLFRRDGEIVANEIELYRDLDSLPFPDRSIPRFEKYYTPLMTGTSTTTMITSRGCPNQCVFCNTRKDYRSRSPENIADEIEECVRMGINELFFIDDIFNVSASRVIGICREIIRRDLKVKWGMKARCDGVTEEMLKLARRAGCFRIHYGVETGTDEGLRLMDKKITVSRIEETFKLTRRCGIMSIAYFMIGCPHEKSRDHILQSARFASRLKADYAVFALYSPYPDTQTYRDGISRELFESTWEEFLVNPTLDISLPTLWEEHFSQAELLELFKIAHRKFYFSPRVMLNALFTLKGLPDLARKVRGLFSLIKLQLLGDFEKHGYLKHGDETEKTNLRTGRSAWFKRRSDT